MKQLKEKIRTHQFTSRLFRAVSWIMVVVLAVVSIVTLSCNQKAFIIQPPPFLPPECYNCTEVTPLDLVNTYFSGYANAASAEVQYNNRYFVFKNIPVRDWVIAELDKGWIWVGSGIKCLLLNSDDLKRFKTEDKIDVVGFNTGVISYQTPGLLFKDCYALAAG